MSYTQSEAPPSHVPATACVPPQVEALTLAPLHPDTLAEPSRATDSSLYHQILNNLLNRVTKPLH